VAVINAQKSAATRRCRNLHPAPVKENQHKKKHRTNASTSQRTFFRHHSSTVKLRQKKAVPQLTGYAAFAPDKSAC